MTRILSRLPHVLMQAAKLSAVLVLVLPLLAGCGQVRQASKERHYLRHSVQAGETLYSIAWRYGYDYRHLASWNRISPPYQIFPGQELVVLAPDRLQTRESPRSSAQASVGNPGARDKAAPEGTVAAAEPMAAEAQIPTEPWVPMESAPAPRPPPESNKRREAPKAVPKSTQTVEKPPLAAAKSPPSSNKNSVSKPQPDKPAVSKGERTPVVASRVKWSWPTQGTLVARFAAGEGRKGIDLGGKPGQPVKAAADGEVVYSGSGLIGYGKLIIIKHDDDFLSAYGFNRRLLVKEGDKVKAGKTIAEMGQSPKSGSILHFEIRRGGKPVDPLLYLPYQQS